MKTNAAGNTRKKKKGKEGIPRAPKNRHSGNKGREGKRKKKIKKPKERPLKKPVSPLKKWEGQNTSSIVQRRLTDPTLPAKKQRLRNQPRLKKKTER